MKFINKKRRIVSLAGFTLMELLLSLSIMVILAGVTIPVAWPFVTQNDLDVTTNITTQTIRRAQSLSMSMLADSIWGVKLDPQTVTLFKGGSYDSRDAEFDEVFNITHTVNISGPTEIYFSKLTGQPNLYGNIEISNNQQQIKNIFISQQGVITN